MKLALKADRPTLVVGCTLGLFLLLALYWILHFWLLRQDFVEQIESLQPRTARLLGISESYEQLQVASAAARGSLLELAYPAGKDSATAAAAMQQSLRELMAGAGLEVSGSQILPTRKADGFDRLSLDISAQGNVDALDEALLSLELMRPLVLVESLSVKPVRERRRSRSRQREPVAAEPGDQRQLTVRFQLISLRLVE